MSAAAERFSKWAASAPPSMPGCKSLEGCLASTHARNLYRELGEWAASPEALAVVVGMVAAMPASWRQEMSEHDLVNAWAWASVQKEHGVDINESRFLKWAQQADSWEAFFEASITGIRVLHSYGEPCSPSSAFNWVMRRDENQRQFTIDACSRFYESQPSGRRARRGTNV